MADAAQQIEQGPTLCDEPGCGEVATVGYVWPWGKSGFVCSKHQVIRSQQAKNLKRQITFTSLAAPVATPLARDERTRLIAAKLSAEAELDEVRQRAMDFHHSNERLATQARTYQAQKVALEAELKHVMEQRDNAMTEAGQLQTELAMVHDENQRLKALIPAPRGESVVEG